MQIITVELLNDKALTLLQQLEQLQILRLKNFFNTASKAEMNGNAIFNRHQCCN